MTVQLATSDKVDEKIITANDIEDLMKEVLSKAANGDITSFMLVTIEKDGRIGTGGAVGEGVPMSSIFESLEKLIDAVQGQLTTAKPT